MKVAAEMIKGLLQDVEIQAQTAGREFWELANEEITRPFITYNITENARATKDRAGDYNATIFVWHETLGQASDLADLVKDAATQLYYRGGESGYTDGDTKVGYIALNFNFKIRI